MSFDGIRFVFLVACTALRVSSQGVGPSITLKQGQIVGTYEMLYNDKYSLFRGIPYAKPPKDSLRFKDPEKHEGWSSTLDATKFGSGCPQVDVRGKSGGDEDCLFVNVLTPLDPQENTAIRSKHPVMVFIHGGNFERGSSVPYGANRFIGRKVVLVTFNYRLGVLGFLSTGDAACPGNLGLKDQVLALQWVRDNIDVFDGDSNLVTIFGQDAGATSVFLHILSPMSKDLFQRAITQSGSPLCDRSIEEHPYSYATEIAKRLKCSTKSTRAIMDCIRQKPVDDILKAQRENKIFGDYPFRAIPVVENGGFLPDTPSKLLSSGTFQVPLISGVNRDDGSVFYPLVNSYREELRKNASFLLTQLIPKFLSTATDIRDNIDSISHMLLFEYFNEVDPMNMTHVLQSFVNMSTDSMSVSCNHKTLQLYSATGARSYMYTFEYRGIYSMLNLEQNEPINFPGVSHGEELMYLFDMQDAPIKGGNDGLVSDQLLFLWTTFARTGMSPEKFPNDPNPKWEPYTHDSKNYYQIGSTLADKVEYRRRAVDLWLKLLPALSQVTGGQSVEYKTGGFGWAMLAIALILMVAVVVLAVTLFRKSKSQYFETSTESK